MPRHNIPAILLLLVMLACNPTPVEKPVRFIPHNEMVAVMTDIQLADAYITDLKAKGADAKDITTRMHDSVFMLHGIERKIFDENLIWYSANIEELDKVYTEIISNLAHLKAQDSIAKQPAGQKK
jgi:hypothetical protein